MELTSHIPSRLRVYTSRLPSYYESNTVGTQTSIYGFLEVDLTAAISLKEARRLASWGSRYGKICCVMRPFVGALHRLAAGRSSHHATFLLSEEAMLAIRCWRAMQALTHFHETRFSRTIESFGNIPPCYVV